MALIPVMGFIGTRESGWPASLWFGLAAMVWLAQENTDRMFNEFSVNVVTVLLIGMLALLLLGCRKQERKSAGVASPDPTAQSVAA
jgi:cytochrome bd-type quinol oxidase subunit 2